jgi:hypothetical protein
MGEGNFKLGDFELYIIAREFRKRAYCLLKQLPPIAEACEGGVLIRPALVLPVEVYTPERKAQFLLSNAVDAADYAGAVAEVHRMGLDPKTIPHYKPPGV